MYTVYPVPIYIYNSQSVYFVRRVHVVFDFINMLACRVGVFNKYFNIIDQAYIEYTVNCNYIGIVLYLC